MKACPYCAEQIQEEAIICRYCGNDTRVPVPPPAVPPDPAMDTPEEIGANDPISTKSSTREAPPDTTNAEKSRRAATTTEKLAGIVFILSIIAALVQLQRAVALEGRLVAYTIPFINVGLVLVIGGLIRLARGETTPPNSRILVLLGLISIFALPLFYFVSGYITTGGQSLVNPPNPSECVSPTDIDSDDVGEVACVEGIVQNISRLREDGTRIIRLRTWGASLVLDSDRTRSPQLGDCVRATGVIREADLRIHLEVERLDHC